MDNKWSIYGAGKCSLYVIAFCAKINLMPEIIYVSNATENPKFVMGIPVRKWEKTNRSQKLIIAVRERSQAEIKCSIAIRNEEDVFEISDGLFYELGYEYEYSNGGGYVENVNTAVNRRYEQILRFIKKPCMDYMVLNILDHCNLRCRGCDHFACIAEPYFVSKETIHKDLDRMAELLDGDYLTKIGVMGGEPLLHPDLLEILADVRAHFPYSIIRLTTNGLLLGQQNDKFWRVLRENDVSIVNTKYPLKIDHEGFRKRAEAESVKFMHFEGTDEGKKLFKKKINIEGTSNPVQSFGECHISNYGNFLMEGKLYGCPFSCQSYRIFNKKFNQHLRMTDVDYLDIYKIKDKQEIFEFAARPKYYCRYCMGLSETFEWEHTKQRIEEWV